jgi:hypothetical protein
MSNKKLNHKIVIESICKKFNMLAYTKSNFTHFTIDGNEVGYIEQIKASKMYFKTMFCNFFNFDNPSINDEILTEVKKAYLDQRLNDGAKYVLELRGTNINETYIF